MFSHLVARTVLPSLIPVPHGEGGTCAWLGGGSAWISGREGVPCSVLRPRWLLGSVRTWTSSSAQSRLPGGLWCLHAPPRTLGPAGHDDRRRLVAHFASLFSHSPVGSKRETTFLVFAVVNEPLPLLTPGPILNFLWLCGYSCFLCCSVSEATMLSQNNESISRRML